MSAAGEKRWSEWLVFLRGQFDSEKFNIRRYFIWEKNIYSAVFAVQAIALNPHAEILYIVVGDWGMTEF